MTDEIIVVENEQSIVTPVGQAAQAIAALRDKLDVLKFVKDHMFVDGVDYMKIPGTDKPALTKPGAEKLCSTFSAYPIYRPVYVVRNDGSDGSEPYFYFEIECTLYRIGTNEPIGSGVGSCNSKENKYRWRWVTEEKLPVQYRHRKDELESRSAMVSEFAFSIEKAETAGQYGKPKEYWDAWKAAIETGAARRIKKATKKGSLMDAWEMGGTEYRIPNPDIHDLANTIRKMADKRALTAAALVAFNASQFFTQDVEDWEVSPINSGQFSLVLPSR